MKTDLDTRLREWAESRAPSPARLEALGTRIRGAAQGVRASARFAAGPAPWAWAHGAAALAAALVAGVCIGRWSGQGGPARLDDASPLRLAAITDTQFENRARLFGEMRTVFDDRLKWVADWDHAMDIGVGNARDGFAADGVSVLVRLVVVSRASARDAWQPLWQGDVMLREQEVVQLNAGNGADGTMSLWAYPLRDGKVVVDLNLALDAPARLGCVATSLLEHGKPVQVMSVRSGDGEYMVLEAVRVLNGRMRGQRA